jgi:hypothetical protein
MKTGSRLLIHDPSHSHKEGTMKKTLVLTGLMLFVLTMHAAPVAATSPYFMESRCEYNDALVLDPSANGDAHVCLRQATKEGCEQYNFCWWRDTTDQNAIADHSEEHTGDVHTVYSDLNLKVLMYSSTNGANVTALIASSEMFIVGAGGSHAGAGAARFAFQANYNGFIGKTLRGIVLPDIHGEDSWGLTYWRTVFPNNPPAPLIVNAAYENARQNRNEVDHEYVVRDLMARGKNLTWGSDSLLGEGSMRDYRPDSPSFLHPGVTDLWISEPTTMILHGIPVMFIPTSEEDAGLLTYLPLQGIMIAGNLGAFLPDVASLPQPSVPIEKWMQTLATIRTGVEYCTYYDEECSTTAPEYLITGRGMYISGAADVNSALTVQYDALNYLHNQTLKYISYDFALDDIVQVVHLPANLANSPYARQFTSTQGAIVRAIYHEHLGWFDGNVANLESLSTAEQARRLIDFGGGEKQVLSYARKCITEHTRNGALEALKKISVLRQLHPSEEADAIYIQALKMLGWTTPSAHLRNYYLSEALKVQLGQ